MSTITIDQARDWLGKLDQDTLDIISIELGLFKPNCTVHYIMANADEREIVAFISNKAGVGYFPPIVFSSNGHTAATSVTPVKPSDTSNDTTAILSTEAKSSVKSEASIKGVNRELINEIIALVKKYGLDDVFKAIMLVIESVSKKSPKKVSMTLRLISYFVTPAGRVLSLESEESPAE